MTQPVPRSGGATPVPRPGGSLTGRGPLEPNYETADGLGLERLPEEVIDELESAGLISEAVFMDWADDTVTKRRRDGSHYQQIGAWWASLSQLNVVVVRRELEPAGEGRLRPRGAWMVTGTSHELPPDLTAVRSVWRFQAPAGNGIDAAAGKTDDPLEMLPTTLTIPVAGGEAHASLRWRDRWAKEQVIAYRLVGGRVRMLSATRESTSRRKLTSTDWTAEELDASVVATMPINVGGSPAVGRGVPGQLGKSQQR
jgi:hypothetical protein